jgi:hypothetical protein
MDFQKKIFKAIREQLTGIQQPVNVVSEVLGISLDASYRRMRGEKELSSTELIKLCSHFNISVDCLSGNVRNNLLFRYEPLDLENLNSYRAYIRHLTESVTALSIVGDKEIYYTSADIPIFHFLPCRELSLFKVYVWYAAVSGNRTGFEKFLEQMKNENELFICYDRMVKSYNTMSSTEIWTESAIDPYLRLIDFYYGMGLLGNGDMAKKLCYQLTLLIKNVKTWAETGTKNSAGGKYRLFLSPVHPENSFMLLKKDGYSSVTIKLYTTNSITTTSQSFCKETEQWINNIMEKSMLLSETSIRERNDFFKNIESKIQNLMNRIQVRDKNF